MVQFNPLASLPVFSELIIALSIFITTWTLLKATRELSSLSIKIPPSVPALTELSGPIDIPPNSGLCFTLWFDDDASLSLKQSNAEKIGFSTTSVFIDLPLIIMFDGNISDWSNSDLGFLDNTLNIIDGSVVSILFIIL